VNFLVTGGAGFIGSHVCERLLHSGHAVWALDNLDDFYDPRLKWRNLRDLQSLAKPFEFVQGDVTDQAALADLLGRVNFDQIIHLAARAGVRPSLEEPALYQRVNVEGTVNLLEAARGNRVRKVIIASSSSVYGVNSRVPFAEGDPIFCAVSPYAASKLAFEAAPIATRRILAVTACSSSLQTSSLVFGSNGTERTVTPRSLARARHGATLAWWSSSVTTTSSPGPPTGAPARETWKVRVVM